MPIAKTRRFRPSLDRLEPVCLLSAGLRGGAMVHQKDVIDLKPTQVGRDALTAIAGSTAKFSRGTITLVSLTADDADRTVRGGATVDYRIGIFSKVTSNITFKTSLDDPNVKDVKVKLNKFDSWLSNKDRMKVAEAIVKLIKVDHDKIEATFVS